MNAPLPASGLDHVVAADTVLSDVQGDAGRLIIRGHALEELSGRVSFEEVVRRLFDGFFPSLPIGLAGDLGAARVAAFAEVSALDDHVASLGAYDAMRALVARLPDGDDLPSALRLLAAPAVFLAAALRRRAGQAPIAPDPALGHAADLLRMAGLDHGPVQASALDAYLVTVIDHGLNASTFAARVVASTRAGLTSSVLAGLGALKGPLHGGAPGPVIDMLDAIETPDAAVPWLEAALDRGDRLMGFGHRVYRVRDPRADVLKAALKQLAEAAPASLGRLALSEAVEAAALDILKRRKPDRPLDVNVEFYTAILLEALGLPPSAFTGVFAAGRTAGWIAHAREQVAGGRLLRPLSRYVGPMPG